MLRVVKNTVVPSWSLTVASPSDAAEAAEATEVVLEGLVPAVAAVAFVEA